MGNQENGFAFGVSSIWEIAIKKRLQRPDFRFDPRAIRRQLIDDGYEELPVLGQHAGEVDSLPPKHKDPFDRILIAQAMVEGIALLTADAVIAKYPDPIRKVRSLLLRRRLGAELVEGAGQFPGNLLRGRLLDYEALHQINQLAVP